MALEAGDCFYKAGRALALGLSLSCVFAPLPSAFAQEPPSDAAGIINEWFDTLNSFDTVESSYGAIETSESPRSAQVKDGVFTIGIPSGQFFEAGAATIRVNFGTIAFHGLRQSDTDITADRIEIPGSFNVAVEFDAPTADTSDKAPSTPDIPDNLASPQTAKSSFNVSYHDVLIEGFSAPRALPGLDQTNANPLGFIRSVLDTARKLTIKRAFITSATATSLTPASGTSSTNYQEMSLIGVADGRIAEQYVAGLTVTEQGNIPGPSGVPEKVEFSAGPVVARGFDIAPLAALVGAPVEAGRTKLLDREEFLNIEFTAGENQGQVQSLMMEDLSVATPTPLKLFSLIEKEAKGEPVSEDELGVAGLEAMGAFAIGRLEMNGFDFQAKEGQAGLRRFLIRDLSRAGLGEFSLSDFSVAIKDEGEAAFDYAGISGIGFPPLSALTALEDIDAPTPQQLLDATPTIEKVLVSAFGMNSVSKNISFGLDLFELTQGSHIGQIPTRSSLIVDGLSLPTEQITDEDLKQLLQGLNIDEVSINQSLSVAWNPQTKELSIRDLTVDIGDGGTASLSLILGNVAETLFTNPEQAQQVLTSADFIGAELRVKDADLITAFLNRESAKNQISKELLADSLVETAKGELGPLAGTAFSEELLTALRSFLNNPEELAVSFQPTAPVPVAEILGLVMTSPQALPERLGAKAVASTR